ncbi:MAG: two-component regulator propeller domain-containing protein, partial [Bacteroidota bacterium]
MTRALPLVLLALGFLHVPLLHGQGAQSTAVEVEHAGFLAKRWTTEHGLPVNHITDLLAARDGYLWIATHDGLTRFDGHRFTVFNTGNSPALSSNRIDLLHETPDGTMWLRTESFAVARVRAGRLESVPDLPEVIGRSFRQDADTLWLTTAEGLYRHDARGLRRAFPELIDEPVTEVVRDGRGALWVVGAHTLYRIGGTPGEASVRRFTAADGLPSLADGRLVVSAESFSVLFDVGTPDQEALWVGGVRGLTRWDGTQFEAMYPDAPVWDEQKVLDIQQAADGTLSFGTSVYGWFTERAGQLVPFDAASRSLPGDESLRMLTDATGRVWRSQHDALYRDGERVLRLRQPGYRFRRAATIDAHGTLWIGADGLYQIRRREVQPLRIDADPTQNSVYPLLETRDGSIWLGAWAERGLARWTDGRLERYSPATDAPEASDFATALHEDDQGTLWIGTLNRLGYMQPGRPSGSRFQRLEAPIDATLLRRVSALHTDTEGVLWLGSEAGLARLQLRRAPLGGPEAETGITVEAAQAWAGLADVRMLTSTRDGHLLLGTMGRGLGRSVMTLSNVTATSSEDAFEWLTTTDGLPSNYVRDAYEEADGTLWIATQDRGLCRLDRSTHRSLVAAARAGGLRCLDVSDGLFDNSLHRVLDDGLGRLWLSSNRGLFWLDRAALDAYLAGTQAYLTSGSYTERDGMHSREANGARSPAGVRASDGRLWFPTQDGAVVIDPRTVAPLPPVPVRIESVEVRDSTWIPSSDPIVLPTGVHDVRIAYTSLAFERPETVRYRVRLDGYDDAWGPPTTERRAAYTNLPPGTYTLRIEASRGGAWSTPATLTLVRPPRFWETRVFAGLVLVVLGIAGMGLYRQRVRHLTRRQAALEATVEARTAEIRANEGRLAKQTARLSLQTTLLAEQAAALRQADATKSRFLANLTHEFRTPLTLTFGPLDDLLGDRYTSVDEARPVLRRARRHGQRLLRLINQLLDLARMDAEAVLLQPTHVDLASFVRQRVAAFGSGLDAHTLHLDLPADPLWHHCDTALLETALLNLLGNAVKFTPPGGHVSVRLRAETNGAGESVAVLAVQDTGPGIEPKHQPFVFERFYQVDASDTRAHEGSGIGLALVQEVVRLHGGSVAVES